MSLVDKICYYQRNLEKYVDDKERILHCISKLHNLPVTVQHLQETGVGRTVNSFRKCDGTVGDAARALVFKWKTMVADEESSDGDDEDEPCVPDVHKNYPDSQASPKAVDAQENTSSTLDQPLESKHVHKENKSRHREGKGETTTKCNTTCSSKSKSEDKHELYDKSKHSSKHHSHSEKKSSSSEKESKSGKSNHSLTKQSHNKTDDLKKDKSNITKDNEDNIRKRKSDTTNVSKENKKRKLSDVKSDEEKFKLLNGEKNFSSNSSKSSASHEQSDKQRKQEKASKTSSSKLKSEELSDKAKDSSDKQKHKKDEDKNHKKHDAKRDSSHHSRKESSKVGSSGDKTHSKNKETSNKNEYAESKNKHIKQKDKKMKLLQEINSDDGIDNNSGTSFAEALGMCTMSQPSKKRASFTQSASKLVKTESLSPPTSNKALAVVKSDIDCSDTSNPSLLAPNIKLEPLSVDLVTYTLPEINPNYKPLPHVNTVSRREEFKSVDDIIYVKNQRTKVYSGNKPAARYGTKVPTLYDMCLRVLMDNIDALEYTGGVPYDILKPILERATVEQLFALEQYNPYLIEDTNTLWEYHCNKDFRGMERKEMESWRDMYVRCLEEREAKLKNVTANIKQSIDNSVPVRSTKLAYVDNVVKPPRNVLKKQAKYGTASATPVTVSSVKKKLASPPTSNIAASIAVPAPPMVRFKALTSNNGKKTKAPLMAKALQFIKGRYKR